MYTRKTEYPFLKDEDGLIKEALAKKLPMIGVCAWGAAHGKGSRSKGYKRK